MLEHLKISNYALIDHIDIRFEGGLNIITGETGAGKSIILGALGLLLGGRADQRVISNPEAKTIIEAYFNVAGNRLVEDFCSANDIEPALSPLIIRRELSAGGRSRAFINDSPATLAKVQELGLLLIDIHSQHQNQLLAQPAFQLRILDSLADNEALIADYRASFDTFRRDLRHYRQTKESIDADSANADFIEYQLSKLSELDPSDGELKTIEEDLAVVEGMADQREAAEEASALLNSGEPNVIDMLNRIAHYCDRLGDALPADSNLPERLQACITELTDISDTVQTIADKYSVDSSELDYMRRRASAIRSAISKCGVADETQLVAYYNDLQAKMNRLEEAPELLASLEKKARVSRAKAVAAAALLSESRKKAAAYFGRRLQETAMPLGMKNLRVDISVEAAKLSPTGADDVSFLFAFNKNQTPTPVANAASGGEISRVMLSIKSIVADRIALPTVIFDEIDTGVSGDVAARIGSMLRQMGHDMQVIAITHLPQVASMGLTHFKVYKEDDAESTHTRIARLSAQERVSEIALMLSGSATEPAARANAEALLRQNPNFEI